MANRQIIVPRYPSVNPNNFIRINVIDNGDGTVSFFVEESEFGRYASKESAISATGDVLRVTLASFGNQSANQVLAGPTSGGAAAPAFRALVAADIPSLDASIIATGVLAAARGGVAQIGTADQGYLFGVTNKIPEAQTSAVVVSAANQVRVFQWVVPARIVISKITLIITTLSGGSTVTLGIYDTAMNKLLDSGTFSGAATATLTNTLGSPVTITPGVYYFAQSASDNVVAANAISMPSNMITILNNQTIKKIGVAANAAVAGVLPATLGSITATSYSPVSAAFEA